MTKNILKAALLFCSLGSVAVEQQQQIEPGDALAQALSKAFNTGFNKYEHKLDRKPFENITIEKYIKNENKYIFDLSSTEEFQKFLKGQSPVAFDKNTLTFTVSPVLKGIVNNWRNYIIKEDKDTYSVQDILKILKNAIQKKEENSIKINNRYKLESFLDNDVFGKVLNKSFKEEANFKQQMKDNFNKNFLENMQKREQRIRNMQDAVMILESLGGDYYQISDSESDDE